MDCKNGSSGGAALIRYQSYGGWYNTREFVPSLDGHRGGEAGCSVYQGHDVTILYSVRRRDQTDCVAANHFGGCLFRVGWERVCHLMALSSAHDMQVSRRSMRMASGSNPSMEPVRAI